MFTPNLRRFRLSMMTSARLMTSRVALRGSPPLLRAARSLSTAQPLTALEPVGVPVPLGGVPEPVGTPEAVPPVGVHAMLASLEDAPEERECCRLPSMLRGETKRRLPVRHGR